MRGLGAYLQHGLGVMPGEIAAETGRLSASVPTPRRTSSRLGSGLLITTVVVQAYKEAGQTDRRAGMHAAGPNRAKIARGLVFTYIRTVYGLREEDEQTLSLLCGMTSFIFDCEYFVSLDGT